MRVLAAAALLCVVCSSAVAETADQGHAIERDIAYQPDHPNDYARERGVLDIYYPEDHEGFATVVWFHAGGLLNGEKWIPPALRDQGIAVVAANYRFSPKATAPAYIEDAAAAVAWTLDHIAEYGGDPNLVFVSGHSAGGYLASMIGLDNRWLEGHERNPDQLAGLIPVSGHTITHFTVRAERDIPGTQAIIDDLAPQFHVRPDCPPVLLITGDREMELLGRYEENAFFWRMMQEVGHPDCTIEELGGFDHGGVVRPSFDLVLRFIERISASRLRDPATPARSD
ncbi:MAG: alpha/beta hydrolase [Planctomycetota bacterium]